MTYGNIGTLEILFLPEIANKADLARKGVVAGSSKVFSFSILLTFLGGGWKLFAKWHLGYNM